ncbi:MAG: aminotransferase class I/II-fold pyridoxal phosphate-dependent enzyme [Haloarculaceae archaeon]
MEIEPFELERWFARHEHGADVMLAESGVRSLPAEEFDLDPGELGYVIPTEGDPALRERVGGRYGRSTEEVLFTCGTQEANFVTFAALVDAHAVVVTPTYGSLHAVPAAFGEVTRVELSPPDWELDPDAVAEAIRPETDVVVINNPNNPTGRYHDAGTVEAVYDLAADADAYLLGDEVYRLLADEPRPPVASLGPRGVSTTGLSKSFGLAGLRFGWVAGPPEVTGAAARWKDYTTISPPKASQHVARQVLDREAELLERSREHAAANRERFRSFAERYGLDWYEGVGVNAFVGVPDGFVDGRSFCERVVEEESVVLAPGESFGFPDRFRLGFGLPTGELREGLDRLGRFLDRHARD